MQMIHIPNFEGFRAPVGVGEAAMGIFAIRLESALAGILYADGTLFVVALQDYYREIKVQTLEMRSDLPERLRSASSYLLSRQQIAMHLNTADVPDDVLKLRTAKPLNGTDTVSGDVLMYRYSASWNDFSFDPASSKLRCDTYLAPLLDTQLVNTGYGAVGRYSLPCPYPARFLHQYIIPKGTAIRVGTVEPQFGQSGGGVEVQLMAETVVLHTGTIRISDY